MHISNYCLLTLIPNSICTHHILYGETNIIFVIETIELAMQNLKFSICRIDTFTISIKNKAQPLHVLDIIIKRRQILFSIFRTFIIFTLCKNHTLFFLNWRDVT
ncbi:Uncharacterised protein [Segatella copri]|nr:Uncharacterised protein [Segatella copri]